MVETQYYKHCLICIKCNEFLPPYVYVCIHIYEIHVLQISHTQHSNLPRFSTCIATTVSPHWTFVASRAAAFQPHPFICPLNDSSLVPVPPNKVPFPSVENAQQRRLPHPSTAVHPQRQQLFLTAIRCSRSAVKSPHYQSWDFPRPIWVRPKGIGKT